MTYQIYYDRVYRGKRGTSVTIRTRKLQTDASSIAEAIEQTQQIGEELSMIWPVTKEN